MGSVCSVLVVEVVGADRDGCRELMTAGLADMVGKYWERACLTTARAARKLASAAATLLIGNRRLIFESV